MSEQRPPVGGDREPRFATDPGRAVDPMQFLGEAWIAYLSSALRGWSRIADAWARALPVIGHTLAAGNGQGELSPQARAALVDELRALFRELADHPAQESRRLQAELDRIAGAFSTATDVRHDDRHWRRWKAKP